MKAYNKHGRTFVALAIGAVLLYSSFIFIQQKQLLMAGASDFSCFYSAGKMVNSGNGTRIYDYEAQAEAQKPFFGVVGTHRFVLPFIFLPFVLVIFAPLALLSYFHALMLWYALNVCLLISVPFLLRRRLGMTDKQLGLALLATGFFLPSSISLGQGQPTILTLVLFALIFLAMGDGHELRTGCLLALTIFKPQFALPLLLALAITRRWKAVAAFFGTSALLFGLSVAIVGWRTTLSFPRAVAAFSRSPAYRGGEYNPAGMSSLRGLMLSLLDSHLPQDVIRTVVIGVSVILVAAVLLVVFTHRPRISDLDFSLIIVVTLLSSYHAYGHDLILLLLPLFLVANYISRHEFTYFRLALGMMSGLLLILPSLLFPPPVMVVAVLLLLLAMLKESLYPGAASAVRQLSEPSPSLEYPSSAPVSWKGREAL